MTAPPGGAAEPDRPSDRSPRAGPAPLPVVGGLLDLDGVFRLLGACEDALSAMERAGLDPQLRSELATLIGLIHGRIGLSAGGRHG